MGIIGADRMQMEDLLALCGNVIEQPVKVQGERRMILCYLLRLVSISFQVGQSFILVSVLSICVYNHPLGL